MVATPPPGSSARGSTGRRRSPLKVVLIVLGCLVGLVLLAGLALLGWARFRPLLPADYNLANSRVASVGEQVNFVGESVGQLTTVLPQGDLEVIGASAQSVRDQAGLAADAAAELDDLRATSDPEVERGVAAVQDGVGQLQGYLEGYADGAELVAEMNLTCAEWAQDPDTEVDSGAGVQDLERAVADCERLAGAVQDSAPGAWSEVGAAQRVLIDGTRDAFVLVESDPDDFDAHYAAQRQAREDYEEAVRAADQALADELGAAGDAAAAPINELGGYTQEQAAG